MISISDEKLQDKLEDFYYHELRVEMEEKPERLRRREAHRRAIRSVRFFNAYNDYVKTDFDLSQIKEIFNISKEDADIMNYWIRQLFHHGKGTLLFAEQGGGKSNAMSFACEMILILRPNWDILTNLPFAFAPKIASIPEYQIDRIHIIGSMSEMLKQTASLILQDRIPAVEIDEMDSSYIATQTRSNIGISFKTYVYVERHFDTKGPLMVYHRGKDIPIELRNKDVSHEVLELTLYRNYKHNYTKRVISNPTIWRSNPPRYRYLPVLLTHLPYHNQGFGPYLMDVDMQWINQRLVGTQKSSAEMLLQLLEEWESMNKKGKKKVKENEE